VDNANVVSAACICENGITVNLLRKEELGENDEIPNECVLLILNVITIILIEVNNQDEPPDDGEKIIHKLPKLIPLLGEQF
jgi:hypothetical protein